MDCSSEAGFQEALRCVARRVRDTWEMLFVEGHAAGFGAPENPGGFVVGLKVGSRVINSTKLRVKKRHVGPFIRPQKWSSKSIF